jgi:hypothetical protein
VRDSLLGRNSNDLTARIRWLSACSIDYVAYVTSADPSEFLVSVSLPDSAEVAYSGPCLSEITDKDQSFVILESGEKLTVVFQRTALTEPWSRTLALVVDGYYVTPDACGQDGTSSSPVIAYVEDNRPEPFNPRTNITFGLHNDTVTTLRIYSAGGRLVADLYQGLLDAGDHTVTWDGRASDGRQVASGIYFFEVRAGGETRTSKLVLVK